MTGINEQLEIIIAGGELYPPEFVEAFGKEDMYWFRSNFLQRELSLRHDMVTILLCNLQPRPLADDSLDLSDTLGPPAKRPRLDQPSTSSSSSTSGGDRGVEGDQGMVDDPEEPRVEHFEDTFRYIILEGRGNVAQVQNKLSEMCGYPPMRRHYDIFDQTERKFIEVKCTKNYERSLEEYEGYEDPKEATALIHMNPDDLTIKYKGKRDEMPGEDKAKEFLAKRLSILQAGLNYMEATEPTEGNLARTVLKDPVFNSMVEVWGNAAYWDHRDGPMLGEGVRMNPMDKIGVIPQKELKRAIEDTSKRNAPFMQFKGKILPPPMVSYKHTTLEKDSEMVDLLLKDTVFSGDQEKADIMNGIVSIWEKGEKNTFSFIRGKDIKGIPAGLKKDLGIGARTTIRSDDHESLRQETYKGPEPRRYSAWMSNLLKSLTDQNDIRCFIELSRWEIEDPHPMAIITNNICDVYYKTFSQTKLAEYCSSIKNVYSRLGGAYLKRGFTRRETPEIVIFPIYAVGVLDGVKTRKVTGLLIRGPQHARKPTDKIPMITIELAATQPPGTLYHQFIKNPTFLTDNHGNKWIYRVNSIPNISPTFLSFIINSTYLSANLIGELTMGDPGVRADYKADIEVNRFTEAYKTWIMERAAEGVMMAVLGGSQEEGALAIIRKIFMLRLNWKRNKDAFGSDLDGLADALNECLIDAPLALYFGQQARMFLQGD